MKTARILDEDGTIVPLSPLPNALSPMPRLSGTANQIELASVIRENVQLEFDRLASLLGQTDRRSEGARVLAALALSILEEKRQEVMAHDRAGYFIQSWQEFGDRLRHLIMEDPRYRLVERPHTSETK